MSTPGGDTTCAICHATGSHARYTIREMMIGLREEFAYFMCAECGCLQIASTPPDMAKYYGDGYYSFSASPDDRSALVQMMFNLRTRYYMTGTCLIGKALAKKYPNMVLPHVAPAVRSKRDRILDIGCGTGADIHALRAGGYSNTLGADPFIDERIVYKNGLAIEKKTMFEIEPAWDVVIMNHSLEHMPDQHAAMQRLNELLAEGGTAVVSIPIVSSVAWEKYKTDWIQADAPRHFFLHSVESFTSLVEAHGLEIERTVYNSWEFQFFGSELYRRDVPFNEYDRMDKAAQERVFTPAQMAEYRRQSGELNRTRRGDQITAYIRKDTTS